MNDLEKLPDLERKLLVDLILTKLNREGCAADPSYTALLTKLSGVDTVAWVGPPRAAEAVNNAQAGLRRRSSRSRNTRSYRSPTPGP
jgi:hypothetical protein